MKFYIKVGGAHFIPIHTQAYSIIPTVKFNASDVFVRHLPIFNKTIAAFDYYPVSLKYHVCSKQMFSLRCVDKNL